MKLLKFCCLLLFVTLVSCVPHKKYQYTINKMRQNEIACVQDKDKLQTSISDLSAKLVHYDMTIKENELLLRELRTEFDRFDRVDKTSNDILKRYDRLLKNNIEMLQSSNDYVSNFNTGLNVKESELSRKDKQLQDMTFVSQKNELKFQNDLAQKDLMIKELQGQIEIIERKNEMLDAQLKEVHQELEECKTSHHIANKVDTKGISNDVNAYDIDDASLKTALYQEVVSFSKGLLPSDVDIKLLDNKLCVRLSNKFLFNSGTNTISDYALTFTDKLGSLMKENEQLKITIVGHSFTDTNQQNAFTSGWNYALALSSHWIATGIDKSKINISSKGDTTPLTKINNALDKIRNSRVEIYLE
ncbi:MAG: OmpA family protein [Saprospiraceae bacterium]|nr:OmpA family protein [Saprospiraceae bacterium]